MEAAGTIRMSHQMWQLNLTDRALTPYCLKPSSPCMGRAFVYYITPQRETTLGLTRDLRRSRISQHCAIDSLPECCEYISPLIRFLACRGTSCPVPGRFMAYLRIKIQDGVRKRHMLALA